MVAIARLQLITPNATDDSVVDRTILALDAGVRWLQVRTKAVTDRERLAVARRLSLIGEARGATVLVNDRADIAVAVDAAGVHVGADDLPIPDLRTILGPDACIGATCRTAEEARRAADDGASYVGAGPVFPTTTKRGLPDPIGLTGLEAIALATELPVVAISGITIERVPAVLDAGAHGVAVVGAIFDAHDVLAAARSFVEALGAVPS